MAAKSNNVSAPNAAEITAQLFAQLDADKPQSGGMGLLRGAFRIVGNMTRDSGNLVAEVASGARASKVAYAVARQESEAHHQRVIEARLAKLLAQ